MNIVLILFVGLPCLVGFDSAWYCLWRNFLGDSGATLSTLILACAQLGGWIIWYLSPARSTEFQDVDRRYRRG